MTTSKSKITRGAIISYISIFFNIVISLVYTPWMIKQIGVSDYGLYSLVGTFLSYFLLDFGLSGSITRFISKYRADGNEEKISNMLGIAARVYLIIDIVIFVVLFILYFFLANIFGGLTLAEIEKLKVLYCIAGIFSLLSFLFNPVNGAMMAYELFVENKLLDLMVRVGTVSLIILALLMKGNVYHIVFITGAVGFATAVVRYVVFTNRSGIKINWRYFERTEILELFSFSAWMLLAQVAQMFSLNLVPTILGVFNNTTEISIFSVGRTLEGFVFTISTALNGLFLPMVSRMVKENDRAGIFNLMVKVGRIQLFVVFLLFSGICVFGGTFIDLWVGETLHSAYYITICLVSVSVLSLTMQIGMDLVYAENMIKHTAIRLFACSLIGLLLSIIVAPKYGAVGCAITTGFALVLAQVLFVQFYQKHLGLDMKYFFKECHLKILPLLGSYAIVAYCIIHVLGLRGWLEFVLAVSLFSIGYLALVFTILFNEEEKGLVSGVLNRIKTIIR